MFTPRFQLKTALFYFLIAAVLGVVLRIFFLLDTPLQYRHIVHGHSHLTLLGWVYLSMTAFLMQLFLKDKLNDGQHKRITWATHITIVGMLCTFPFQGYALMSIIFSTLFLCVSYWFTIYFIRSVKPENRAFSYRCMKHALILMAISSIGPWSLGAIMSTLGPTSVWYKTAIYFYLHFLYNGAFMLFLTGLFFKRLEEKGVDINKSTGTQLLTLFLSALGLSFLLSILFVGVNSAVHAFAIVGGILQLVFFLYVIKLATKHKTKIVGESTFLMGLACLVVFFLLVKCVLQILSGIPYFTELTLQIYDFIIAYLHLTFLGVISLGLLFFARTFKLLRLPKVHLALFIFGVLMSESLLVYRGMGGWLNWSLPKDLNIWIAITSVLIPLSLVGMLLVRKKRG